MSTEALMNVFGWIGIFVVGGCVVMMIYRAFDALRSVVSEWRWQYKYKHRFDKPPTAACYCKDCAWHGKHGYRKEKCGLAGEERFTPDNGFCYEAKPMTRSEAIKTDGTETY